MSAPADNFEHLFQPIQIGSMQLRNRIMLPPHGAAVANLFGTDEEADINIAYFVSRARDGAAWIDGITGYVDNTLMVPGFVPSGLGATVVGIYRMPHFIDRASRYGDALHKEGACATAQLVLQGGMPHGPSQRLANYTNNSVPHELTHDEISWLVDEYVFSAGEIKRAGLDGVELHANHEDLLELFMSPATNHREDEYGGNRELRLRFIKDILEGIRAEVGTDFTVGVRMNMDELFEGGYDLTEGIEIAKSLEATGHVSYLHGVMGNNWGAPSYIQPHNYSLAQWGDFAGKLKQAVDLPIVYAGRVSSPQAGEEVIANGYADVVGMARAMFAEPNIVSKAKSGHADEIRPCIGCNDCLHARVVEFLPFGCSVNPRTGHETEPELPPADPVKKVLVIGGGPAGMELAALVAERGHNVMLWERGDTLGGQMSIAAKVPENRAYGDFITFQQSRLAKLGVDVQLGLDATADAVADAGVDVVAIATGAQARGHEAPGAHLPFVVQGRDVMEGKAEIGENVVVIAMEDHMQPLTIASYLTDLGKNVQIVYQTPGIAPVVAKPVHS
ncbi:MAG: FAD-dependent oxidoreductase [Gammaproteobacteria bacterium]